MAKTHFSGAVVETDLETLVAAGAVSVINALTLLDGTGQTGDIAITLADGEAGQRKLIVCKNVEATFGFILTPTNLANGTTIEFDAANEVAELVFDGSEWNIISTTGTVA